jgi:hypothetical protein
MLDSSLVPFSVKFLLFPSLAGYSLSLFFTSCCHVFVSCAPASYSIPFLIQSVSRQRQMMY